MTGLMRSARNPVAPSVPRRPLGALLLGLALVLLAGCGNGRTGSQQPTQTARAGGAIEEHRSPATQPASVGSTATPTAGSDMVASPTPGAGEAPVPTRDEVDRTRPDEPSAATATPVFSWDSQVEEIDSVVTVTPAGATGPPADSALHLTVLHVHDSVAGREAFRMLIPEGWQADGGVLWRYDRFDLATVAMRVSNPDGLEALEFYPLFPFVWVEGGIACCPEGTEYLGHEVVRPITDPTTFVRELVLPRYRRGVGARVVNSTALPEVEQAVAASSEGTDVTAVKVRVEYREAGHWVEEDFYVVLFFAKNPYVPGSVRWGTQYLYSFKAERGKLDSVASLMQALVSSVIVDEQWFSEYQQVVQMAIQNGMLAIRSAGELSRIIAQTSEEISQIYRQAYENRQATYDRVYAGFSRAVRGVETYRNPYEGRPIQLPSQYSYVWVSPQGEYTFTNDPGYDPNVGSTQTWRRMEPVR